MQTGGELAAAGTQFALDGAREATKFNLMVITYHIRIRQQRIVASTEHKYHKY